MSMSSPFLGGQPSVSATVGSQQQGGAAAQGGGHRVGGRGPEGQETGAHSLADQALRYHRQPLPGKIKTVPSKPMQTQQDLALAYSPGVAEPCLEIAKDPRTAALYTNRQHMVAVISNGTAVLGLGNLGALASKPVMEGKAALFQKFSGLNAIDIEVDETDPDRLIQVIAALAPSFGGINLEDIKAPECFQVEQALEDRLDIPVFHDDQHGTAITVSAAVLNALHLVGKSLGKARCVVSGAGASALACLQLLVHLGLRKENVVVCDSKGVIHSGRSDLTPHKAEFARDTRVRHLEQAVQGADILIGLSKAGAFTPAMVASMADRPIVMALANPVPEIYPHEVVQVAPGALVGTGRSDLPNQINNVLCFPYIFRGALDVGASHITLPMKVACVRALAGLARQGFSDIAQAYGGLELNFGPEYILPKAFDPRLGVELPVAVAAAAMACGVARHPVCLKTYRRRRVAAAFQDLPVLGALVARLGRSAFSGGVLEDPIAGGQSQDLGSSQPPSGALVASQPFSLPQEAWGAYGFSVGQDMALSGHGCASGGPEGEASQMAHDMTASSMTAADRAVGGVAVAGALDRAADGSQALGESGFSTPQVPVPQVFYQVDPGSPAWPKVVAAACLLARYGWARPGFVGHEAALRSALGKASPLLSDVPIFAAGQLSDQHSLVSFEEFKESTQVGEEVSSLSRQASYTAPALWAVYDLDGHRFGVGDTTQPADWIQVLLDQVGMTWAGLQTRQDLWTEETTGHQGSQGGLESIPVQANAQGGAKGDEVTNQLGRKGMQAKHDSAGKTSFGSETVGCWHYPWQSGGILPEQVRPWLGPFQNNRLRQQLVWNCSSKMILEASALVALGQVGHRPAGTDQAPVR